jgi:hypothetical protein
MKLRIPSFWMKEICQGACVGSVLLWSGCASFELTSIPEGAVLFEGTEQIGSTPYPFEQFSGQRVFTVKKAGYVEQDVLISSLDQKSLEVRLDRVRTTILNTVPTDVRVVRTGDSKELGKTSLKLALSRSEVVVLEKEGYQPFPMTLEPNKTYKVKMEPLEGFRAATFVTSPAGALVSDRAVGDAIARTPANISAEEGTEFEFSLEGYQPAYYMINKRSPSKVFVELIPVPTVTLLGSSEAVVYGAGGGDELGVLPYTIQIRELRAFEVKQQGYYPKTVTLSPDSPVEVAVELDPIPLKQLRTQPPGATVARIGMREVLGTAPIALLAEAERLIEVYLEGYARRVIGIGPDSPAEILVELQPLAKDTLVVDELQRASITVF